MREVRHMALTKSIETASLSIEVQIGTDKADYPIFSKKTFSNVRTDAAAQNVYDVGEAIKGVM
jgi:hypothetical protein